MGSMIRKRRALGIVQFPHGMLDALVVRKLIYCLKIYLYFIVIFIVIVIFVFIVIFIFIYLHPKLNPYNSIQILACPDSSSKILVHPGESSNSVLDFCTYLQICSQCCKPLQIITNPNKSLRNLANKASWKSFSILADPCQNLDSIASNTAVQGAQRNLRTRSKIRCRFCRLTTAAQMGMNYIFCTPQITF